MKAPCSIEGCTKPAHSRGWCSEHYHRWFVYGDPERKRPTVEASCAHCGALYQKRWPTHRCCSQPCVDALRKQRDRERSKRRREASGQPRQLAFVLRTEERPPTQVVCAECGKAFEVTKHRNRKFCSHRCGNRAGVRSYWHRLRTNPIPAEHFTIREIAERDGWLCHLCSMPVTDQTWSLDHLIPVSKGGPHVRSNVKLAHHSCNSMRKNRDLEEYCPTDAA